MNEMCVLTPLSIEMYELILSAGEKELPLSEITCPDKERTFTY